MKKLFKLSWRGIPIGIIASILIGTAVLAAVLISVTQHIGQEIVPGEPPISYGSITAPSFDLANVTVGGSVSYTADNSVVVVITQSGAEKWLHLDLTPDGLYTDYSVELKCTACPVNTRISVGAIIIVDLANPTDSHQLGGTGIYKFDQTITATAGMTPGDADVIVVVSLEDTE